MITEIAVILLLLGIGVLATEFDILLIATANVFLTVFTLDLLLDMNIWGLVTANPLVTVALAIGYIFVGVGYALLIKYPRFLKRSAYQIECEWKSYCKTTEEPSEDEFRDSVYFLRYTLAKISDKVAAWTIMWPSGVVWDLINRPVRMVYRVAINSLSTTVNMLVKRIVSQIIKGSR